MDSNKNILLGYSGHAFVVIDAALKADIPVNYYADKYEVSRNPFSLEYIGFETQKNFEGWNKGYGFILGIGDNLIRTEIAELVIEKKEKLLRVTHPATTISKNVEIGVGTFIAPHVSINALSRIGNFVILNTHSVIEHECVIEDGVHIAPGAVLAGNVKVGKRSFIGANAVIKEGVTIGADVLVGAGSTIIRNIENGKKVVGNPGREI